MQLFYTTDIQGDRLTLGEEESRHCLQALRKRRGDVITVVDGLGGFYEAVIEQTEKRSCTCRIQRRWRGEENDPVLHIAIAPTKNINRLEWFLEKATEIGIQQITPIVCRYSERKAIRADRLEKILLSAMKQSQRSVLPGLSPLTTFEDLVNRESAGTGQKFIAYIDENVKEHLRQNYASGRDVCILIGPEGGFSVEEVALAVEHGFQPVHLGKYRLRTETAGIVACHTVNLMNEQQSLIKTTN
jgi:16S rRNA (uracil1498-N3)-methyltransferase